MDGLRPDTEQRYWIREQVAEVDIGEVMEQAVTEVKIDLTSAQEYIE
jgi:hypothetical protein